MAQIGNTCGNSTVDGDTSGIFKIWEQGKHVILSKIYCDEDKEEVQFKAHHPKYHGSQTHVRSA